MSAIKAIQVSNLGTKKNIFPDEVFSKRYLISVLPSLASHIAGWVYPVVTHWAWDGGWLSEMGYSDFAGSGVVHLLGAACALVGCAMIGPRRGRFTKDGKPIEMAGHSVPFAALGGFILLFGFLAFNGGSQVRLTTHIF